jgi:hypothetical protein
VVIGAVKLQSVASDCYSVAAEVARSSLVVLAISSKRVRRLLENRRDTQEIYAWRFPPIPPLFTPPIHSHRFALRLALLAAESVGVDIHGDVAVGVAHQRLHSRHILVVLSEKTEIIATGPALNMP